MERELRIRGFGLGGNNLEAYSVELEGHCTVVIEQEIEPERRRLWELVVHGMQRVPSTTRRRLIDRTDLKSDGFFFFGASEERNADPLAVLAASMMLEEMEPSWVRAVEVARALADSPEVMAAWCELPIEADLAATGDWRTQL